jgi:PAS domain S-box-containing protein
MVKENAVKMLKGQRSSPYEFRVVNRAGKVMWAMETVTSIQYNGQRAVLGNFMPIDERKQMEEELQSAKNQFQVLVEASPLAVSMIKNNGIYQYVNPKFVEMFGYTLEDIPTGRDWFHKAYPDKEYRKQIIGSWLNDLNAVTNGKRNELERQTFNVTCKDGAVKVIHFRAVTLENGDQIMIYEDITQLQQAQIEREALLEDLKTVNQRLEESNRELQDFVYVASHDLREPLRKIASFGMLLKESLADKLDDDEQENFDFMIDGSTRMQNMVDDLLTYSRVTTRAKPSEKVDLNSVINNLKKIELANQLEETGGTIDIPEILPPICSDPSQVHQLLQNLITNGLKFHRHGVPPKITINAHRIKKNMVRIEVNDNGIGIDKQYHEEVFTMFKRLHSRTEYEGTGIGLAVCKKIVSRHGGEIGVNSTPGQGTTFWFTLPVNNK